MVVGSVVALALVGLLWLALCRQLVESEPRQVAASDSSRASFGFLHPSCAGGGGGERVLWCAVRALCSETRRLASDRPQNGSTPHSTIVAPRVWLYTARYRSSVAEIRAFLDVRLAEQFGAEAFTNAVQQVRLVPLYTAVLLEPRWYPYFTMLFQLLAGMPVAVEIMLRHASFLGKHLLSKCVSWFRKRYRTPLEDYRLPSIFIDTVGVPLALLCLKWWTCGRIRTGAYVHYPFVSNEMMSHEPRSTGSGSRKLRSVCRRGYYRAVVLPLYAACGAATDLVMANSSWTLQRMEQLWCGSGASSSRASCTGHHRRNIFLVYPPCGARRTHSSFPALERDAVRQRVVSIAQFRPEKRHETQLDCFVELLQRYPRETSQARLLMIGGARNHADRMRAERLLQRAVALTGPASSGGRIEVHVNASRIEIEEVLAGEFGCFLHTMEEEHFGISIVEAMSHGLLVIAHGSGGAALDILRPVSPDSPLGLVYRTRHELTECLADALFRLPVATLQSMQRRAYARAQREFSDEAFSERFLTAVASLCTKG
jgi:alpha-1,2-mannosyltransferase